MGTVTVSIDNEKQRKLNHIKEFMPELSNLSGDKLTREFLYHCIHSAALYTGYVPPTPKKEGEE